MGYSLLVWLVAATSLFAQDLKTIEGIEVLEQSINKNIELARSSIEAGDFQSALEHALLAAKDGLKLDPETVILKGLYDELATIFSDMGAHAQGIEYTYKAIEVLEANQELDRGGFYWRYGRIGTFYTYLEQYDSAIVAFFEALRWTRNDSAIRGAAYNNIGYAYLKSNDLDSARFYLDMAMEALSAEQVQNSTIYASINDNIAEVYMKKGEFQEAYERYFWNYKYYKDNQKTGERLFNAMLRLCNVALKLGKKDLPAMLIDEMSKVSLLRDQPYLRNRESMKQFEGLRKSYYRLIGDRDKERYYAEMELKQMDTILMETVRTRSQLSQFGLIQVKQSLELERLNLLQKEADLKFARQKSINNLLLMWIILGVSVFAIILFYLNYQQKIQQRKMSEEILAAELSIKKRNLEEFALSLSRKQEWTRQILNRLKRIKNLSQSEISNSLNSLLNEVKGEEMIERRNKVFQDNIGKVNAEFYQRLSDRYPNLTKTERELAGLIRMELSGKEIADLRNMEASSVKRARNRLRKKLELEPDIDIYTFLQKI